MNSQHTPGPWAFCNETLCQATGNYLHLGRYIEAPGLRSAGEANKRLIEAAPAMFDALAQIVAEADKNGVARLYENTSGNPHVTRCAFGDALAAARAILTKARGEQ